MRPFQSPIRYLQTRLLWLYLVIILSAYGISQCIGMVSATHNILDWWRSPDYAREQIHAVRTSLEDTFVAPSAPDPQTVEPRLIAWFERYTTTYFKPSYERRSDSQTSFMLLNSQHHVIAHQSAGAIRAAEAQQVGDGLTLLQTLDPQTVSSLPAYAITLQHAYRFADDGTLIFVIAMGFSESQERATIVAHLPPPFSFRDSFLAVVEDMLPTWVFGSSFLLLSGFIYTFLITRSLNTRFTNLTHAATAWAQGHFTVRVTDASRDELGQLTRHFNQMADQLDHLLQERQLLSVMTERNRVARDLHDSIKQQIFAASMQLSTAHVLSHAHDPAYSAVEQAMHTIQTVQKELTAFLHELRPVGLQHQGLVAALRHHSATYTQQTGIHVALMVDDRIQLPFHVETALFRIAQEAFSNVLKHSHATTITCSLSVQDHWVRLSINDNGQGFGSGDHSTHGLGLVSMRERIEALDGYLQIRSTTGGGTHVLVSCPMATAHATRAGTLHPHQD